MGHNLIEVELKNPSAVGVGSSHIVVDLVTGIILAQPTPRTDVFSRLRATGKFCVPRPCRVSESEKGMPSVRPVVDPEKQYYPVWRIPGERIIEPCHCIRLHSNFASSQEVRAVQLDASKGERVEAFLDPWTGDLFERPTSGRKHRAVAEYVIGPVPQRTPAHNSGAMSLAMQAPWEKVKDYWYVPGTADRTLKSYSPYLMPYPSMEGFPVYSINMPERFQALYPREQNVYFDKFTGQMYLEEHGKGEGKYVRIAAHLTPKPLESPNPQNGKPLPQILPEDQITALRSKVLTYKERQKIALYRNKKFPLIQHRIRKSYDLVITTMTKELQQLESDHPEMEPADPSKQIREAGGALKESHLERLEREDDWSDVASSISVTPTLADSTVSTTNIGADHQRPAQYANLHQKLYFLHVRDAEHIKTQTVKSAQRSP